MKNFSGNGRHRAWLVRTISCIGSILALQAVLAGSVSADMLTLAQAERLALAQDPAIQAVSARQKALEEQSVAAAQLPDPMLKLGVTGLPADSFALGEEAMTQVQVGVVQKFPRGQSRHLSSLRLTQYAGSLELGAEDQRLQTLLSVREAWYEVLRQKMLAAINQDAISELSQLLGITEDYYETGRVQQQDVLRARVELERARDRAMRIAQDEEQARARLATWIGPEAYREVDAHWPEPLTVFAEETIKQQLQDHPRIQALLQEVAASETGVELAEQTYKPEFGLDLSYGGRAGNNPDGSSRADLLSFMVTMDVPLFTGKRQDRTVAASIQQSSAARFNRDDVYRRMRSDVEFFSAALEHEQQRLELFETSLLPDAEFNAEAAFQAYQAALETLTTLMRARITEYELQLEHARLQADTLKTRARLRYLQGEPS